MIIRRWSLVALLLCLPTIASAQDTHLIVIAGVGGSEEHTAKFHKWATSVLDTAKKRGVADANVIYLGEQADLDPARVKARSTRDSVLKAFNDTAARAKPNDEVFVLLIGHGSFDGRTAAFNLPGPDLTADDYRPLLEKLRLQRVAFINTASSSGAFLEPLAGPGRTIVTATRTGGERNEPRFAEFFIEAFTGDGADRDRNGRVSVQEAFDYAKQKVTAAYEQAGHLLSEHAALNDGVNGKLASMQFLAPQRSRSAEMASLSPALRALVEQRDAIEREIEELKLRKDAMEAARYDEQLEKLLTDLALKTRQIREAEAKK
ncbi:MAG: hypothetical protein FJW27_09495 [Acidimicrobiia bacterium]|nr:hypothetical protein [Acidimicrobiia bacterium]